MDLSILLLNLFMENFNFMNRDLKNITSIMLNKLAITFNLYLQLMNLKVYLNLIMKAFKF